LAIVKEYWLLAVLLGILSYILARVLRYGSFKGAIFGAKIRRQVGTIGSPALLSLSTALQVFALEDPASNQVIGLQAGSGHGKNVYLTLSQEEARQLVAVLQDALAESGAHKSFKADPLRGRPSLQR